MWHIAAQREHCLPMQFLAKDSIQKVTLSNCSNKSHYGLITQKKTIGGDNGPALVQVIDRALAALGLAGVESAVAEGSVPYVPKRMARLRTR